MINLLYIFLGLVFIILLYKLQYIKEEKRSEQINKATKPKKGKYYYKVRMSEKQNLNDKYNIGTYRDKKGRFRSLKSLQ